MANRSLMFELLEKQHLMSIFGALSGLLLFQDGVFANSFCDRLFAHIETDYDKITRSLHRNENSDAFYFMCHAHVLLDGKKSLEGSDASPGQTIKKVE